MSENDTNTVFEAIKLVIFIVNRGDGRIVDELCTREGLYGHLHMRGRGTVDNKTASLLGLDERERDIVLLTLAASKKDEVMARITEKLRLHEPGRGIAMSIPFSSIASQFNSYAALAGLVKSEGAAGINPEKEHEK